MHVLQPPQLGSRVSAFWGRAGLKISLLPDRPRMAYVYSVFNDFWKAARLFHFFLFFTFARRPAPRIHGIRLVLTGISRGSRDE